MTTASITAHTHLKRMRFPQKPTLQRVYLRGVQAFSSNHRGERCGSLLGVSSTWVPKERLRRRAQHDPGRGKSRGVLFWLGAADPEVGPAASSCLWD